ncbi:MAG: tetratricopeptide repeat protein [Treponema sp.]|nr:tetratricopeptide repeat protein [Treponema sp.]
MSDATMMLERARAALIAHDYTQAAKIYKNLILENPSNIEYKMNLGNLYTKAGKDDQALTLFKQVEKADNENLDALVAISGVYRRQKRYEESVAYLEQALVMCEDDPKSRAKISYNLGFTYRQMGNYDDAINCFEEVVEENPSDVLANNHLGAVYALQGKHTKAIEAYHRGLKYDSNHPILQFNIAKSYAEIGETQKALTFYEGALRAKPGWTDAIEAYADLLLCENKVTEADNAVTQALELYPDDFKMHTAKGNIYNRQSTFEDAEHEFKKALTVDDEYKNALTGLAHSLESQGKLEEALSAIKKAESLNPDNTKIIKQSAHIHISANKLDDAYEKISKLQQIDENDVETLNLLGQYYIVSDMPSEAEECFANLKKINPDYNDVYRDWGERFMQKGNVEKAEPYLQAAIQKNPHDSVSMVHLGELYEEKGELGKALQYYHRASEADIFNQRSKRESSRLLEGDPSLQNALEIPNSSVDYDSIFSGGKLNPDDSEEKSELSEIIEDLDNSEGLEIHLKDDSSFPEDDDLSQISEDTLSEPLEESENLTDELDMQNLADNTLDINDVDSVAGFLEESGESTDPNHLENLTEEESTVFEISENNETELENPFESENPEKKPEISDESLNRLEDQIKKVAELTEKLNFATEKVVTVAEKLPEPEEIPEKIPESLSKIEDLADSLPEAETEEGTGAEETPEEIDIPEEFSLDLPEGSPEVSDFTEDSVTETENHEPALEEPEGLEEIVDFSETDSPFPETSEPVFAENEEILSETEELPEIEETLSPEEIIEEESFADEELLNEEDLSDETESEDFLEDIPEALKAEESFGEAELIEDEEEPVKIEDEESAPAKDTSKEDLAMQRAIDMLPTIAASVEDRSLTYRYREYLELFKTLRDMLEFLPPSQQKEFMMSKNRVMLDFIISKLSGKAGLFATSKALIRSGLLHENENARGQDLEGIPLAREVLEHLRELGTKLNDDYLRDALDTEALKVLEKF